MSSVAKVVPATKGRLFTPSDSAVINPPCRGILIDTEGPVAVVLEDDTNSFVIPKLAAGIIHPLCCKQILDTGTTVTSVALFF